MALLEELKPGVLLKGLLPGNLVTVIDVKRQGSICVELTYKDANGHFDSVLLYRESEPRIEIASEGLPWSFDAHGATFRLTSEAYRINLAYLLRPTDSRAYLANRASATSKICLVRDIIMAACIRCNTAKQSGHGSEQFFVHEKLF